MLSLTNLLVLCRVVERSSISEAAKELFITQPAVTHHIRTMEKFFGTRLVLRQGNRLAITEAGQLVYDQSKEVIGQITTLKDELSAATSTIRFGVGIISGSYILPHLLAKFRKSEPKINISVTSDYSAQIYAALQNGTLDAAMTANHHVPPDFVAREVYADRLVFVASPGNHLANRLTIPPEEISQTPLVVPLKKASRIRSLLDRELAERQIVPNIYLESRQPEVAKQLVAEDQNLIALLPYASVYRDLAEKRLVVLEFTGLQMQVDYVLLFPRSQGRPLPHIKRFTDFLSRELAHYPEGIFP